MQQGITIKIFLNQKSNEMKNLFLIVFVAAIFFACQPKPQPVAVDLNAAKAEVNALMETYLTAWNAKDAKTLASLITDDGLYCGSDPTEWMDKKTTADAWTMAFADTTIINSYSVEKREIRVASDGNSAIVMEQFTIISYTPKIPWRLVGRAVKTGDGWKLDFISWNFIPKNEDIGKLNMALE
jgi:uncharacterized protein (TIGR02246 family)